MRIVFGVILLAGAGALAIYNIKQNKNNEITGPSLSLIFASLLGLALLCNIPFKIGGFNSQVLDQKVQEATSAKNDAIAAKEKAEEALKEAKKVYALNLLRTGRYPSKDQLKKNKAEAQRVLKSIYEEDYQDQIQLMKESGVIPLNMNLND